MSLVLIGYNKYHYNKRDHQTNQQLFSNYFYMDDDDQSPVVPETIQSAQEENPTQGPPEN